MKSLTYFLLAFLVVSQAEAQKFEQLGTLLPTPDNVRTASGAPGKDYWQQQVDYKINVAIDDENQVLTGEETITYHNNSPESLTYLWVQLDQNNTLKGNLKDQTSITEIRNTMSTKELVQELGDYDYKGGFQIKYVKNNAGLDMPVTINRTMMRIDLPTPLTSGATYELSIGWSYNIYDRMLIAGRGGFEYFPKDDNYLYTCAQWYPRMCVYDDVEGWQNKQFIDDGEFALEFGNFEVNITVPADHIVAATGELGNAEKVLTKAQQERFELAKNTFDKPVVIATEEEAIEREKTKAITTKTWTFRADSVRDFAFASSRKFIWDAQAVNLPTTTTLAMSYYPKEGNTLWGNEATSIVKNTLEIYSSKVFDYPYPVAIAVNAAEQGMEYPMISFNSGRPQNNGKYNKKMLSALVDVIVHEIGHNYFPMIINSDERMWGWMDEGINTFFELETKRERYPELDTIWGSQQSVLAYMRTSSDIMTPVMTPADNITFAAYTDYAKPSAALNVLRELVMGPELFDFAFKEYANRWKFKRPKPTDFFRTMEDASAVDLDWFWRGWFYTIEPVDVSIEQVKWYRTSENLKKMKKEKRAEGKVNYTNFESGSLPFSLVKTDRYEYGEFTNNLDDEAIIKKYVDKNFYEVRLENLGGLLSPIVIAFVFEDGTMETQIIPAEIWRTSDNMVQKVFCFDKEVKKIILDPNALTGDIDVKNNVFPRD
ncbi:MAG TPA: M1 family metallopeptidase [Fulvivirga sp.]|nr:M1 family metallopeptidase [Fulvivirga sp.]